MLRKFFGSLLGSRDLSPGEVVFERLDDPAADAVAADGIGRSIEMETLLSRVPVRWRQQGEPPLHEKVILPQEAILPGSDPREPRYSLRYLARYYPSSFRDPGILEPDPGVTLPAAALRSPALGLERADAGLALLPPDTVAEVSGDPATFAAWEGDATPENARREETLETRRALRGVQLPKGREGAGVAFGDALSESALRQETVDLPAGGQPALAPTVGEQDAPAAPRASSPAPNMRLRRILAAYAETLPELSQAEGMPAAPTAPASERRSAFPPAVRIDPAPSAPVLPAAGQNGNSRAASPDRVQIPLTRSGDRSPAQAGAFFSQETTSGEGISPVAGQGQEVWARRLPELKASLERFSQVSGFAFWAGPPGALRCVGQSGSVGFNLGEPGVAEEMQRVLRARERLGGGGDPFASVTFQSAGGGVALFGGEQALVAVAYRGGEGIPEGLRGWLCGWVAKVA